MTLGEGTAGAGGGTAEPVRLSVNVANAKPEKIEIITPQGDKTTLPLFALA